MFINRKQNLNKKPKLKNDNEIQLVLYLKKIKELEKNEKRNHNVIECLIKANASLNKKVEELEKKNKEDQWLLRSDTKNYELFIASSLAFSNQAAKSNSNVGLLNPKVNKLSQAWKLVNSKKNILGDGKNEKRQVHPFFEKTLQIILDSFGIKNNLKLNHECTLSDPLKVSDFCISSSKVTRPGWLDCLGIIECKRIDNQSNFAAGGGQAIFYGKTALAAALKGSLNPIRFSAVSDGDSIQFFIFTNTHQNSIEYFHASVLEFLPSDSSENSKVTEGFKLLCQLMVRIEHEAISFPTKIWIDGTEFDITSTIQRNVMTSSVSIINKGSGCVVKYSEDSRKYNELLRREFGIYNALKMSGLNILNLDPASTDQMLIFTEIGMTLKNWCQTLDFRLSGHCSMFLTMMIQVLNELKKLHIFGFTHGDIRPANILVIKEEGKNDTEKACLIDFDYSHRIGTSLDSVFGTKEFMAEKLIFMDTMNEFPL